MSYCWYRGRITSGILTSRYGIAVVVSQRRRAGGEDVGSGPEQQTDPEGWTPTTKCPYGAHPAEGTDSAQEK